MFKLTALSLMAILFSANVYAQCIVEVDRTPCKGKEEEALKPYEKKNPTKDEKKMTKKVDKDKKETTVKISTKELCLAEITNNCKIVRRDVLSKKLAWGSWEGKSIADKTLCESTPDLKTASTSDCKP